MLPKSLRPLLPYLKRYRWGYLAGTLCVFLTNGILVLMPLVIGRAFKDLSNGDASHLLRYALLLLAIAVGKGTFQFLTRWIVIGISRDIEFDLRNDLFEKLEGLSFSYYQRYRTGDIMARATNDLAAVRNLLGPAIMYTANTIVLMAGALAFMISISPKLTLYTFLPLPVASIVIQYWGHQIHDRFEKIQAMFSDISARAQENFSGARLVRAYVQEEAEIQGFERDNKEYIRRSLKLVRLMGMLWPTLELMIGVAMVLVLWLGGREVLNGITHVALVSDLGISIPGVALPAVTTTLSLSGSIDVGDFTSFLLYMMQLIWPIIALGYVINIFQRGTASLGRLNEIMQEQPEIKDEPGAEDHEIEGKIEFRSLNFSYNGTRVLNDVNLRVPAGSSLAIVGPTGSGKTTLVNLIPRIYDAEPGTVLIDGRPIRDYSLASLRRSIGFVPQETFLFSDRIRENIALGVNLATDAEIHDAAAAANIAADIESFPEGYETLVGERGITLSGGQKQRTSIARALIRNPRILILDDALSSVDTQTEDKILNHLRDVMRGHTTIFISHRVSTVRNADRIAVLHGGRIVELGTHDELLALNGYYSDLYNKQLLEEELAEV
ncbi:ABC transporter, ATPase subunit [Candidatus Sulfotelmatobacter kueseliae]|uniref:ABC transporter, ATPase subunit n=1 Tax=Candidatus Sulfotelmatobacter kueseliae TaxID=2042962 RepID=A0A2U3JZB7_9BACT|nr:ABC transporter, ATPase subunit [Candidatus Sulfotelmatobacter kueseliae]